ncbi:HTH CENPB-type domain-containing protein [Meloidogyne graminicola]|uniref:HTH CENPB-type domain-containing protein n=1 Tax=Meloidogyne graminicola TaxID=189291 RepID=A0A8S9ZSZ8_9BILA|nr:HTH CENPB-type domain-containing protein [Meloidogyne graminicola]
MLNFQSNSVKRGRSLITIETKKQIIEASTTGKSSSELGKQFNLASSTIRKILQQKEKILKVFEKGNQLKKVCIRPIKYENLDQAVLLWVNSIRSQGIPLNGPLLQEKALELSKQFNLTDFKASEGWLGGFKKRHSISFKNINGENVTDINNANNIQGFEAICESDDRLDKLLEAFKDKKEDELLTLEEIKQIFPLIKNEVEEATDDSKIIENKQKQIVSTSEAIEALKTIQRFIDQNPNNEMQRICNKLNEFLVNKNIEEEPIF